MTPAGSVAWIVDGSYNDPSNPHTLLPLGSKTVLYLQAGSWTPTVISTSATIKSLAAIPGTSTGWKAKQPARRLSKVCVGAAVALSMLLGAPTALAQSLPRASLAPLEGHLRRGLGASESTNWSGYAAYGTTFTSAQGDWTQPTADCESVRKHGFALAAFWVGLDGYEDNTVEQTGSSGAQPASRTDTELDRAGGRRSAISRIGDAMGVVRSR